MQTSQSAFEAQLLSVYGPLLTIKQLATVLHRSPAGLSYTLAHPGILTEQLLPARVKIGRRVYYRASGLAAALVVTDDL